MKDERENSGSPSGSKPSTRAAKKRFAWIVPAAVLLVLVLFLFLLLLIPARRALESFLVREAAKHVNGSLHVDRLSIGLSRTELAGGAIKSLDGRTAIAFKKITVRYNILRLFHKPIFQGAITSIEIDGPQVLLALNKKGELNMATLFRVKPGGRPFILGVEAPLLLGGGRFTFEDANLEGMKKSAAGINALIQVRGSRPAIIEWLKAEFPEMGGYIRASGSMSPDLKGAAFKVKGTGVDAACWVNYLVNDKAFHVDTVVIDGDADLSSTNFLDPDILKALEIHGRFRVKNSALRLSFLPDRIENLKGRVDVTMDMVRITDGTAIYNSSPVKVQGKIYNFARPVLQLAVQAENIPLEKMKKQPVISTIPGLKSGRGSARVEITGLMSSPIVKGTASIARMDLQDHTIGPGKGSFTYHSGTVRFNLDGLKWNDGTIDGKGYVNVEGKTPYFLLELKGDRVSLGSLAGIFLPGHPVQASTSMDVKILGTLKNPMIFGDSTLSQASYDGFHAERISGHFIYFNSSLLLSGLDAISGGGRLRCPSGFVDTASNFVNLRILAENFSIPDKLKSSFPITSASTDMDARILGNASSPLVSGTFGSGRFTYAGNNFTGSRGSFIYSKDFLIISNVLTSLQEATMGGSAWLRLGKNPEGEGVFSAGNISPSQVGRLTPGAVSLPSNKTINLTGFAGGSRGNLSLGFTGSGSLGSLAGFGRMEESRGDGILGAIVASGFDFGELVPAGLKGKVSPGRGDMAMILSGKGSTQKTYFQVDTPGGTVLGMPVNRGIGTLSFSAGGVHLEDVHWQGFKEEKLMDSRRSLTADMYNLSTYWGTDTAGDRRTSLLSRLYYGQWVMEDFNTTVDGWKINTVAPRYLGGRNPMEGAYPRVEGLPPLWGSRNFHQLGRADTWGYPLRVTFQTPPGRGGSRVGKVRVLDANFNGTYNNSSGKVNLRVEGDGINIGVLSRHINLTPLGIDISGIRDMLKLDGVEGDASIAGTIKGTADRLSWAGSINIPNGLLSNEFFSLKSNMKAWSDGIEFSGMELHQAQGTYRGSGKLDFKPQVAFSLDLNADGGKLSRLMDFTPWKDIPVSGYIFGGIKVKGTPKKLGIDGDIIVKDGSVFGQPVNSLSMDFKSGADDLTLQKMSAAIGNGEVQGSGQMRGDKLDFTFSASRFPLHELRILQEKFPGLAGTGSVNLNITGRLASPILNVGLKAGGISLRGHSFDSLEGSALWEKETLQVKSLSVNSGQSSWSLDGSVQFPGRRFPARWEDWQAAKNPPVIDARTTLKGWPVATTLDILDHPLKTELDGKIDGKLSLKGSFPLPDFKADVKITGGRMGSTLFDSLTAVLDYSRSRILLEGLELQSPTARAKAAGEYDQDRKHLQFFAIGEHIPAEIAGLFYPAARKLKGDFNCSAHIWGSPELPEMDAEVSLQKGRLGSFSFDEVGGKMKARKGVLTFDDLSVKKGNYKIAFEGEIPLSLRDARLQSTGPARVRASISENSLDVLGLFLPYIEKTTGKITGSLDLTGIFPDLKIDGSARVRDGSVKLSIMENTISGLDGEVFFNGKDLKLKTLKGKMGEGDFVAEGDARLDSGKVRVEDMNFSLKGNNLSVMIPGLVKGLVSTKVTLTGSQDAMVIGNPAPGEGEDYLTVSRATVQLPEGQMNSIAHLLPKPKKPEEKEKEKKDKKGSPAPAPKPEEEETLTLPMPVVKNFILTMGEDVWLHYKSLTIQSRGSLMIVRQPSQSLRLFGELDFMKGTMQLPFFANTFKVSQGTAYFDGGKPVKDGKTGKIADYAMDPSFELSAETTVSGVDIYFNYGGTLGELLADLSPDSTSRTDLDLYSIPSYSKSEILMLLMSNTFLGSVATNGDSTNTGTHTIEGMAVGALSQYVQGLILSPITRHFGRAFALSDLSFQYSPAGVWMLQASKALDARETFFLTYSQFKPPQGEAQDIWGLEYRYRQGMRLRVEDAANAFIYSVHTRVEFDNFKEFLQGLMQMAKPVQRKPRPQAGKQGQAL